MRPLLATRAVDPDGRTTLQNDPQEFSRVMSPATARKITAMMTRVVQEGTGTAAALQGIEVAGKTGTAERDVADDITDAVVHRLRARERPAGRGRGDDRAQRRRAGGTDAAPIARAVLESLLR